MPHIKRSHSGKSLPGSRYPNLRAADAIALLGGVNYAQVIRVLAAIQAMKESGYELADIASYESAPLKRVDFRSLDSDSTGRARETEEYVSELVKSGKIEHLDYVLRTSGRLTDSRAD